jgi:pimeloyl-ACP methyl ester carboxylesterase
MVSKFVFAGLCGETANIWNTEKEQTMDSWQTGDININGLWLHYTRTGGHKPPVVLVHGYSDDGLCWTPVARALAPAYDVLMVDARGHGHSDSPEQGYGPAEQASDLAGVITALELQHPAILGHSMGAVTALVLAGLYPGLPGAILLEDPPSWWVPPDPALAVVDDHKALMRAGFYELKSKTRPELLAGQRLNSPTWSEEELGPWADSKLLFSENGLKILDAEVTESVEWQAILPRIVVPVLLITADPVMGAALTEPDIAALKALVPQLREEHISGAGHNIRREQFARYMDVVGAFLREFTPK